MLRLSCQLNLCLAIADFQLSVDFIFIRRTFHFAVTSSMAWNARIESILLFAVFARCLFLIFFFVGRILFFIFFLTYWYKKTTACSRSSFRLHKYTRPSSRIQAIFKLVRGPFASENHKKIKKRKKKDAKKYPKFVQMWNWKFCFSTTTNKQRNFSSISASWCALYSLNLGGETIEIKQLNFFLFFFGKKRKIAVLWIACCEHLVVSWFYVVLIFQLFSAIVSLPFIYLCWI